MINKNYAAFIWHAALLAVTATFIEINTVLPAMIIRVGGSELHIGIMSAIMIGIPLIAQLSFAGYLHGRRRKKPFLILGINLRILALIAMALTVINIERFSLAAGLGLIYTELLLFTFSGAFAGLAYIDILGKSFEPSLRRSLVVNKQIISGVGILVSAVIVRSVLKRIGFPDNYAVLYTAAAAALLVASAGFYVIREPLNGTQEAGISYWSTLKSIPERIRNDSNLKKLHRCRQPSGSVRRSAAFLRGIRPGTVPAGFIPCGKPPAGADCRDRDFRIPVEASFTEIGIQGLLFILASLGTILPILALIFGTWLPVPFYLAVFLISGSAISAQKMSSEAVLVEITSDTDRVLYTGIIGTLNLTVALLPILIGCPSAGDRISDSLHPLRAAPAFRGPVYPTDELSD
jgi:hypothetical protein